MKIVDDTSSPTQVVSNYQNLINKDKVDLVFGPFSSLLTVPASTVVKRYGYAFLESAGGGPEVFAQKLDNMFFVQPAPVVKSGDVFADWVLSLPAADRPKTAAYAELDDPFSAPIAESIREAVRGRGHQDRLQAGLPGRDPGLLRHHGQGGGGQARRPGQRHAERGRVRTGQEPGAAEVQPQVHVHVQRRQLAAGVPEQGRRQQHDRHHVGRRLVPGVDQPGQRGLHRRSTSRPTAAVRTRSTTAAPRRTPAASCSRRSPPRRGRSTTQRSSPPCTRGSGRRCSAT